MNRAALLILAVCAAQAGEMRVGKNNIPVRGVAQEVHFYPGGRASVGRPCVLFAPGDGGWRGFAVTMAETISSWGYDVYGLDTKEYLERFTGRSALSEKNVMEDMRSLADAVRGSRRVVLVGWSEGAGLMTLAAAAPSKDVYTGLITMGLGDRNVLGWRMVDDLTYVTRKAPNEPWFSALSYMPKVSPVPLVMVHSTQDEYVNRDEAQKLFNAAAEPRRFALIEAQNHRFDGAHPEFFKRFREALEWVTVTGKGG